MKDNKITLLLALATLGLIFMSSPYLSRAATAFRSGNIFDGGNRTDRLVDWQDPIPADPGEVIEFRVLVQNDGDETAQNVSVRVDFPGTPSLGLVSTAYVTSTNTGTVSDTTTVNVSGTTPQLHSLIPGHTKMYGPGCTPCVLPDSIAGSGITIGPVVPGTSNSFQVLFKAYVTNNRPTPTPTPTPTPNPTPTPTPTPTATPTPTPTTTATPTPTPSATPQVLSAQAPPQLPKTGTPLGIAGALVSLGSLGIYLFRRFRVA